MLLSLTVFVFSLHLPNFPIISNDKKSAVGAIIVFNVQVRYGFNKYIQSHFIHVCRFAIFPWQLQIRFVRFLQILCMIVLRCIRCKLFRDFQHWKIMKKKLFEQYKSTKLRRKMTIFLTVGPMHFPSHHIQFYFQYQSIAAIICCLEDQATKSLVS